MKRRVPMFLQLIHCFSLNLGEFVSFVSLAPLTAPRLPLFDAADLGLRRLPVDVMCRTWGG